MKGRRERATAWLGSQPGCEVGLGPTALAAQPGGGEVMRGQVKVVADHLGRGVEMKGMSWFRWWR